MEKEGIKIAKTALRTKNKGGGITLPDIRVHSRATIISTVWYWWSDSYINQNRVENPEKDPHKYVHLTFYLKAKNN